MGNCQGFRLGGANSTRASDTGLVPKKYGPDFLDNVFSYQVILGANYLFTKTFMISLGYRVYALEVPAEEAIFDGKIKGWIMRIGFQF